MAKQQQAKVVNEVPSNAADMGAAELTQEASKAVTPWASGSMIEFHPTLQEIAKLKEQHEQLLASTDVATPEGYKVIKKAARGLASLRTAVNARRLDETRQAREYQSKVNAAGNEIINKLEQIQVPLEKAILDQDSKAQQEALATAVKIEAEQRAKEDQRLALIAAEEQRKKDEEEAELARRRQEVEEERKKLVDQKRLADEQLMERQRQWEKQQEELAKQKAEFERQQAELRAAQEAQRIEKERTQREAQSKLVAEREAREEVIREKQRKEKAEADRIYNEKRVEEAKKVAAQTAIENERARVAREAEVAKAKAEKERLAAEKKAKQAPDKEKVKNWQLALNALITAAPKCTDLEAIQLVGRTNKALIEAMTPLKLFVEAK